MSLLILSVHISRRLGGSRSWLKSPPLGGLGEAGSRPYSALCAVECNSPHLSFPYVYARLTRSSERLICK